MIIDAKNLIVGRLATFVAKKALLGEKIDIVNCEKAVMTGNKKQIFKKYLHRKNMGTPKKGPFLQRMPDRFVRRIIKNMLPRDKFHGKKAFKKIMCYINIPDKFKNEKIETVESADISKTLSLNYVSINEICKHLGGQK